MEKIVIHCVERAAGHMLKRRRQHRLLALARRAELGNEMKTLATFTLGLVLTACAPASTAPTLPPQATPTPAFPTAAAVPKHLGTLTFQESACVFDSTGGSLATGSVTVAVINRTNGTIWANMVRISGGMTFADFQEYIAGSTQAAREGKAVVPPPWFVDRFTPLILNAGGSASMSVNLEKPGTYGFTCLKTYESIGEVRPYATVGPFEVK